MKQEFRLHSWDWDVQVFYEAGPRDEAEIVAALHEIGCSDDKLEAARGIFDEGQAQSPTTTRKGTWQNTSAVPYTSPPGAKKPSTSPAP